MSDLGIYCVSDIVQAKSLIRDCRQNAGRALKGSAVLEIFGWARDLWTRDPEWKERVRSSVRHFYGDSPEDSVRDSERAATDLRFCDEIVHLLDARLWEAKLKTELPFRQALDGFAEGHRSEAILSYEPLGILLHITPGNSFLGGLDSLLHGLVTGNMNLVKLSRNVPPVTAIIARLLVVAGLPASQARLVAWDQSDADLEAWLQSQCDGVVVWGGETVVNRYRSRARTGTRFIEYGPKLSFSVLTPGALKAENESRQRLFDGFARDVCQYEQASCSSTQVMFVQVAENDDAGMRGKVLDELASSFERYGASNRPGMKSKHEQMEILKALERAKVKKVLGQGDFRSGYPHWVIAWKQNETVEPSPLFRTLSIYSFKDVADLEELLRPLRSYLQTASLACSNEELDIWTRALWRWGVNRVVEPGRSTVGSLGAPHDGGFILAQFSRVVSLENNERRKHLYIAGPDAQFERVKHILKVSLRAPFYRERLRLCGHETYSSIDALTKEQFAAIPSLSKDDIYKNGPPVSDRLMTAPFSEAEGAYLFTTGGTTSAPRYMVYSREEWDDVTDILAHQLKIAGVKARDRVANLFVGGGLWSAFLAVSGAIEKLGAVNLPLGGDAQPPEALHILQKFDVSAIFGLPSTILRLAHAAEEIKEPTRIPFVFYAGEAMSQPMRNFVAQVFSSRFIGSGSYAAVDAGCIAYQCANAKGGRMHHVLESYSYLEICDPESGTPVAAGEVGEIIVTNLSRTLFPVIRERSGDMGRQILESCACGSTAMTFELLGRMDDMVRVGGANVYVGDVEKTCRQFSEELSLIFQMTVDKAGVDDRLTVNIETKPGLSGKEVQALSEKVKTAYLATASELKYYVNEGFLRHFELRLVPPGGIGGNARTHKIKRVVDLRAT